jgi:hypothetical protein
MIPAERTMQLIQSVTQVIRILMLQDLLKKLQEDSSLPCDFAEGTLYLDPDIIDLTMIPPPITPDEVSICGNWSHLVQEMDLSSCNTLGRVCTKNIFVFLLYLTVAQ